MHQRYERLAEMLAVADPPAAVELLLRFICECHEAAGGAVLALVVGQPIAQAVRTVNPQHLAAACAAWTALPSFPGTAAVVSPEYALLLLRHEEDRVGLLYIQEPGQTVEPEHLGPLLGALAKALWRSGGWESSSRPDERALMRRVLEKSDWNVSRAARALGVTRRTIYQRMRRFGIFRRKEGSS